MTDQERLAFEKLWDKYHIHSKENNNWDRALDFFQFGIEAAHTTACAQWPSEDIFVNKWSEIVNDWAGGDKYPLHLFYEWLRSQVKMPSFPLTTKVRLPKEQDTDDISDPQEWSARCGFNAALDEIKRLNPTLEWEEK